MTKEQAVDKVTNLLHIFDKLEVEPLGICLCTRASVNGWRYFVIKVPPHGGFNFSNNTLESLFDDRSDAVAVIVAYEHKLIIRDCVLAGDFQIGTRCTNYSNADGPLWGYCLVHDQNGIRQS